MACVNSFPYTVQVPTYDFGPNQAMKHCMSSVLNVQRKLQNLNPSKEAGSDFIWPDDILKYCAASLPHFFINCRKHLWTGTLPYVLNQGYGTH